MPKELIVGIRPENITEKRLKNKQNSQFISSKIDIFVKTVKLAIQKLAFDGKTNTLNFDEIWNCLIFGRN